MTSLRDTVSYHLNWRAWPWRLSSRPMRALIFRPMRFYIRARRASLSTAVLVVRSGSGEVLVKANKSSGHSLPRMELNCWQPFLPQIEDWAEEFTSHAFSPTLTAVEARCGDFTFVYSSRLVSSECISSATCWLTPEVAAQSLCSTDLERLGKTDEPAQGPQAPSIS